jgi:hypothetical protein
MAPGYLSAFIAAIYAAAVWNVEIRGETTGEAVAKPAVVTIPLAVRRVARAPRARRDPRKPPGIGTSIAEPRCGGTPLGLRSHPIAAPTVAPLQQEQSRRTIQSRLLRDLRDLQFKIRAKREVRREIVRVAPSQKIAKHAKGRRRNRSIKSPRNRSHQGNADLR